MKNWFTGFLLEVVFIDPFVSGLFEEFLFEFWHCITFVEEFVEWFAEFGCVVVVIFRVIILLLTSLSTPNIPLKLIVSFKQLHFENSHSADLVIINILQCKNTWVVLKYTHVLKGAIWINFVDVGSCKIELIYSISKSTGNVASFFLLLVFNVFCHFGFTIIGFFSWVIGSLFLLGI